MVTARAVATIDLAAIEANARVLKQHAGAALMAVVKADAYGHGLVETARAAQAGGADWLGTALLDEGLTLRAAGVKGRIMSWLTTPDDRYDEAIAEEVDVSASSVEGVRVVAEAARRVGRKARLHLEVDTGMTRGGVLAELEGALDAIKNASDLVHCAGIWSHFARADEPGAYANQEQREKFDQALAVAEAKGIKVQTRHFANSAATLMDPHSRYDMVRCGIALYGLSPDIDTIGPATNFGLTPAMTVTATLTLVKDVPAGVDVSYGGTYTTTAPTKVGIVPMGYADGVPRQGSNQLMVSSREGEHRVLGRICMDQFVIDLGPHSALVAGDQITLFGVGAPSADQWGRWSSTIGYEVLTRVGSRVPRQYLP